MSSLSPIFPSRLPKVVTTVFTVMSALAAKHKAINLGQGFPDFSCDRDLLAQVNQAMLDDRNQLRMIPISPERTLYLKEAK